MTNEKPAWAERTLGHMPGLGNDRPRGGAEIKGELDPGPAVVRYLYDNSRVDAQWSVLEERGFTWWADGLAQRVWAELAFDDDGIEICRVFAETELARGVGSATDAMKVIDPLNGLSAGSALVIDPDAGTIRSVASVWIHEQTSEILARSFSVTAAIQIAQAQTQGPLLAPLVDGELAISEHPDSGPRPEPDEMLGLLDLVTSDGASPSLWVGAEMTTALEMVQSLPIVTLATGDETGMSIEVPFRQATALVEVDATEPHPSLGNGMLVRLSLPGGANPGPEWAAMLNQLELDSLTRSQFIGSWVGSASFPTHVSFYPNLLARTGMGVVNIALSMINRVGWLAQEERATEA